MSEPCRFEVLFDGRVQGVGFRATARQLAGRHPVAGYVRNLPDGRVELVAEGDAEAVGRFLQDLRVALGHHIRHEQQQRVPATGEFAGFEIRY